MPGVFGKVVKFSAKAGACAGVVYYTAQAGVWSDGTTGQQTYVRVTKDLPDVKQYIPEDLNLPETSEMRRGVSLYWNWAVIGLTNTTARLPSILAGWAASTKEMLEEMLVITPEQVKEKTSAPAASS
ncbi:uncharacterized protein LOC122384608 [Amphibalanus amphitrite]|uniref:uncharacterized protein LOC122384608 n=1 Tax=Amphibalanus amphitrite TaxID=1232801 RepID=UPI001C92342E|nr:uncharacterized protein LOC122384608 [Amphibalanus amphitrite]XP_043228113.1 uncharacterized protein LOC122384608 [Amphibalanus amphitrite]XP_043228114.1 uncharacterized protein LOC122384608 [Amphibalanus amphitrite]